MSESFFNTEVIREGELQFKPLTNCVGVVVVVLLLVALFVELGTPVHRHSDRDSCCSQHGSGRLHLQSAHPRERAQEHRCGSDQ